MPLKLVNNSLLQTNQAIDFYGASPFSLSIWMRIDPGSTGWTDQNVMLSTTGRDHDTWISVANDGLYVQSITHDTTQTYYYVTSPRLASPPTLGAVYHLAVVTADGTQSFYVNGVLVRSASYPGTEGALSTSGTKRIQLGCYDTGAFSIQDPAIWTGYRLTETDVRELLLKTKNPSQIGTSGSLKWWLTLAGTEYPSTPTVGDASLNDQSASGLNITSIALGSPTYDSTSLTFTFPSTVKSALANPTRNGILLYFQNLSGDLVNIQSSAGLVNPTLTINGGTPVTLSNPIWGASGSYQPWIYYPLATPFLATDTLVLNVPDFWCSTTAGPVHGLTNYPVDNTSRTTFLPDFVYNAKTMPVGYNAPKPTVYYSTFPVYTNYAHQIAGWYNASASFDANQVPTQVAASGTLLAAVVSPPNDNTTNDKGCSSACANGVWALMWDGQATDSGTPLLSLSNGGRTGCSITNIPTDLLPGTTNNTRLFQITQNQSYYWSPSIYLSVRGRSDGGLFNPAISNIRLYGPDPANPTQPLSDTPSKFHPSMVDALVGCSCLRFSLGDSVVDFSDYLPDGVLGHSMSGRHWYSESILQVEPYTDSAGYFGNRATALVTFAAPHNIKNGDLIILNCPGPNSDDSFPLSDSSTGWLMATGAHWNQEQCYYNSSTMLNTQVVALIYTTSNSSVRTLTQTWTASGLGKTWASGAWPNNQISPGMPPGQCCDLANAAGKTICCDVDGPVGSDIWLTVTYNITDACVASLMTLVASRLNVGHKIYLEYANEVWNIGSPGGPFCTRNGHTVGLNMEQWYTLRASQIHAAAYAALDAVGRGGDLVRVFGAQGANAGVTTAVITDYAAAHGIPIDAIAVAPYLENCVSPFIGTGAGESGQQTAYDACNADQLMDLGELFVTYGGYEGYINSHKQYVGAGTSFPDTKIICYEGGPEGGLPHSGYFASPYTSLTNGAKIERMEIWDRHPRMRGIMLRFLQVLQDHGCALFNDYLVSSQNEFASGACWQAYYTWNMKPGMGDGSDGLGDNRLYAAPATVPFQDYSRLVSVVGGAINLWNALVPGPPTIPDPKQLPFTWIGRDFSFTPFGVTLDSLIQSLPAAVGPAFNGLGSGFNSL